MAALPFPSTLYEYFIFLHLSLYAAPTHLIYIYIYIYISLVCSVFQAIMKSLYLYKAHTQTPTFVMLALFQRSLSWHACASDVWFLISLSNSRWREETGGRSVQQRHRLPVWWRQKAATGTFTFSHLADTFYFFLFFYPKRLTNEDNGGNQNQQKSNDMQVL